MKAARTEAERWLRQAESDLAFAELGAREGFPAQACFTSQQAAEKALKAIHYLSQGQFLFEPPTGPVLVQPIDHQTIFRSTQPILMKSCVSG